MKKYWNNVYDKSLLLCLCNKEDKDIKIIQVIFDKIKQMKLNNILLWK